MSSAPSEPNPKIAERVDVLPDALQATLRR